MKDDAESAVEYLKQLKKDETYIFSCNGTDNSVPAAMQFYISCLKDAGLDIGKENAEFGYRMPLPEKHVVSRRLIIFRRR